MRRLGLRTIIGSALLAILVSGAGIPTPAHAQDPAATTQPLGEQEDDDQDWGWVGLLGLAGLLGLKRRDHDRVDTTRRP